MRSESELNSSIERLKLTINNVNQLINVLATQYNYLFEILNIIQSQIDNIRNVPTETVLKYQKIKEERLTWKKQVDKIYAKFEDSKKVHVGICVASCTGLSAINAALALATPFGWGIVGLSLLGSGISFFKSISERKKLEEIFLLISLRDEKKYEMAIVELNERLTKIADETSKLRVAIININTFGYDYNSMTEAQQYALGSYVNLMNSATQLLINPIKGLQPNYTEEDLSDFMTFNVLGCSLKNKPDEYKKLIVYLINLLWAIQLEESALVQLINSFKNNKDFLKEMGLTKDDLDNRLIQYIRVAETRKINQ